MSALPSRAQQADMRAQAYPTKPEPLWVSALCTIGIGFAIVLLIAGGMALS